MDAREIEEMLRAKSGIFPLYWDECKAILKLINVLQDKSDNLNEIIEERTKLLKKCRKILSIYAEKGRIPNGGEEDGNWISIMSLIEEINKSII